MADEKELKGLNKAIKALTQTATSTAMNLAKSDIAVSALNGAVGDMANIPLFKSGASAAKFLGGKAAAGAKFLGGKAKEKVTGKKEAKPAEEKATGKKEAKPAEEEPALEPNGNLEKIKETGEAQLAIQEGIEAKPAREEPNGNLEKIKETGEAQLAIQEGNEEEEKVERVKNDENRREESGVLVRIADGIETLVESALNPKVAEAEGGGFLAGILGMLFGSFSFGSILKKISKPFTIFKKGFLKIGTFFKSIGTRIGKVFEPVTKFFRGFVDKIKSAPKLLNKAFPFIKNIGGFITRVAGKLLIPLTILLAAFDFAKGFFAGFKEGGIVEGIKHGFMGMISGFVDSILNMIKNLASWIATKLGFDGIAEKLNSFTFDFGGMFGKVFDKARVFLTEKVVPFVTEMFSGLFEKANTFLTETVLPWITGFWQNIDFGSIFETIKVFITEKLIPMVTGMFTGLFEKANTFLTETVLPWITGFWENMSFGNIMETIDEFLIQPLTSMFNSIIEFFANIKLPSLSDITGMIPGIDSLPSWAQSMLGGGDDEEGSTESPVSAILQDASKMTGSAEDLLSSIFDKIVAMGSSAGGAIVSTVNNMTSGGDSTTVIPTGFDTQTDPSMGRESWISDF